MCLKPRYLILVLIPIVLPAQQKTDLQQILERMDRLEQENRELAAEVHALRNELTASHSAPSAPETESAASGQTTSTAPVEERVTIAERRVEELAQTKVQTSQ